MSIALSRTRRVSGTVYPVLGALSVCHLINDAMQSLLPAIYPNLKDQYGLTFGQIGLITLVYQLTASLLQPFIGIAGDRKPIPMILPAGTLFTLSGLLILSRAHGFVPILIGGATLGVGASVFHPEASRIARLAAGGRHGLAQSLFQVGGNIGGALGPVAAALIVTRWGQSSLAAIALSTLIAIALLWVVSTWFKNQITLPTRNLDELDLRSSETSRRAKISILLLLALVFSKYVYLSSLTSYLAFYLIERFHVTVQAAQIQLFAFLSAIAVGTMLGGPLGDRIGSKSLIWMSILGALPFSIALPFANLFWTGPLTVAIGLILASAFPAIVVYAQELIPDRVGTVSGLFFGFAFGIAGLGAAGLGWAADAIGIEFVYRCCALLPAIGILAAFLPPSKSDEETRAARDKQYQTKVSS